jgi:hypothetical protein
MSKPAKDEIVLLRLAGEAIRQVLIKPPYCMEGTGCELPPCGCSQEAGKAALAAIRAAGWEVAPQTELDALRAENARLRVALTWFVENDETNEGDTPMPEHGGRSWNEINAYWIEGLNTARAALEGKP